MIFIDATDNGSPDKRDLVPSSVGSMLVACAEEATRMAEALARLDQVLAIIRLPPDNIPLALQQIDLLRQEGFGLARILRMIAEDPDPARTLDPEAVAAALPVWAQCARLHSAAEAASSKDRRGTA